MTTVKDAVYDVGVNALYQLRAEALTPTDSGRIRTPQERHQYVATGVVQAMEAKLADAFTLLLEHPVRRTPTVVRGGILSILDEDPS